LDVIPRLGSFRPELAGGTLVWIAARLRARLRDETLTPLDVGAGVAEIVATLTRTTSTQETATAPPWLARARELIAASCESQLTIGDLARELDLHPVYLSRAFRARTGLGVGELAHRLRVQRAAALLLDPRSMLADVALRCGFADQSHFTRVFRSITGTTPCAFRAQLQ
jgi:AraC family transcriptional regulator